MIDSKIALTSVAIAVFLSTSASAGNYLTLDTPKKESILSLGEAPVKEKIELNLGALRKDEAELPVGARNLFDRMRMRAKRALDRQKALTHANRRRAATKQASNSFVETDNEQTAENYDGGSDVQVIE